MARLTRRFLFQNARLVLAALLLLFVITAVVLFHEVLLPFALAIFLAYLLAPVISWMNGLHVARWQVPRGLAILAVYALILGVIGISGTYLFPRFYAEMNRMVRTLPGTLRQLEDSFVRPLEAFVNDRVLDFFPRPETDVPGDEPMPTLSDAPPAGEPPPAPDARPAWQALVEDYTFGLRRIDDTHFEVVPQKRQSADLVNPRQPFQFNRQLSAVFKQTRDNLEENLLHFVVLGRRVVGVLLTSVFSLFLVLMLSGFLLLDPGRIHRFARSLAPPQYQVAFDDWLYRLDHGLSGVVRGQAIICLVNGTLTGIGISVLGVPFILTLSVLAAVFSLIPIFGVLLSSIPILAMALTVSLPTALLALAWILVIHFIEGNFLNPKILGDSAKIHPVLIVFALLVGEQVAGVVGALLAVPCFSLIQNSFLFFKHQAESLDSPPDTNLPMSPP